MKSESPKSKMVLVVDDDTGIRRLLRAALERSGYDVAEAATGDAAIGEAIRCCPDAVLLDLTLPDLRGLHVLQRLREWTQVPVLIVSDPISEADKITVLDCGANDYIQKPFSTGELLARLRVTLRGSPPVAKPDVFQAGDLTVDLSTRTVKLKGERKKLTPTEYSMLRLFVQNAGKVLTHRQIFREIWGSDGTGKYGHVRVYLTALRSKLASQLFVTEPGVGYRLALQE